MKLLTLTTIIVVQHYVVCETLSEKCSGDDVCIQLDYDRLRLPLTNEVNDIQMKFLDLKILKVNDNECIVKASFWLNIVWHEPRLIPSTKTPTQGI